MNAKQLIILGASALMLCLLCVYGSSRAKQRQGYMVRIAELEIDPVQLENYKAALKEEIEASIRLEPGVLTLYAVSLKENPAHIRIFETYADVDAYQAHIETPHFKKYKSTTQAMVKSLKLVETTPILLGAKSK
jgi:quinol monooxygenase YgiN